MNIVPLQQVPNQTFTVRLNNQNCQLNVYQKATGLFMDVLVNNVLVIGGVLCENLNRIVRSLYLGFQGDFVWVDIQGSVGTLNPPQDPTYQGFGSRFFLVYLAPSDLPANVG